MFKKLLSGACLVAVLAAGLPLEARAASSLAGRILLAVEESGDLWYVLPESGQRERFHIPSAFDQLSKYAIGITNADFDRVGKTFKGKFLLKVEDRGELWYVDPVTGELIYINQQNFRSFFEQVAVGIDSAALAKIPTTANGGWNACSVAYTDSFDVQLPQEVASVGRLAHNDLTGELFMVTQETDGARALWVRSASGDFRRLIKIDEPLDHGFIHQVGGVLFFDTDYPHKLMRSQDGGASWKEVEEAPADVMWSIDVMEDGSFVGGLWSEEGNSPYIYKSDDQGKSWYQWMDFWEQFPEKAVQYDPEDDRRALRHIHDVATWGTRMWVGTGDYLGESLYRDSEESRWLPLMGNGFTSHIIEPLLNRIILGGDSNHGHGIHVHNWETGAYTHVWNPHDCNWTGYFLDMEQSSLGYFAATQIEHGYTKRYGVIWSQDGVHWSPFVQYTSDGSIDNIPVFIESSSDALYISHGGTLSIARLNQ